MQAFANLESLTGIYFIREHTLRILWNYVQEVGLVGVWRKVTSRLQEKHRNKKFVSFGIGAVAQGPAGGMFSIGERVAFLAPGFPACIERIVLPGLFLARVPEGADPAARPGSIFYLPELRGAQAPGGLVGPHARLERLLRLRVHRGGHPRRRECPIEPGCRSSTGLRRSCCARRSNHRDLRGRGDGLRTAQREEAASAESCSATDTTRRRTSCPTSADTSPSRRSTRSTPRRSRRTATTRTAGIRPPCPATTIASTST